MTTRVRRLGPSDAALAAEAIRKVKNTTDVEGFGEDYLERFLARPENLLLVAEHERSAAGFLLAYTLDRVDRDRRMVCLYEIGVVAACRRRGIGRAMLEELKAWCRRENVMKAWVITDRANAAAMALYERAGGRPDAGDDVVFVWGGEG